MSIINSSTTRLPTKNCLDMNTNITVWYFLLFFYAVSFCCKLYYALLKLIVCWVLLFLGWLLATYNKLRYERKPLQNETIGAQYVKQRKKSEKRLTMLKWKAELLIFTICVLVGVPKVKLRTKKGTLLRQWQSTENAPEEKQENEFVWLMQMQYIWIEIGNKERCSWGKGWK